MSKNHSDSDSTAFPIPRLGGWLENSRRTVYDNPWIQVSHCEVLTPAGSAGIYGLVHFKNTAVGVIPIDADGYTWLVRQSRYPLQEESLEIPEGGSPAGEDTLTTAKRELLEEVGLEASEWHCIQSLHLSNSVSDEYGVIYIARGISEVGCTALEDSEDITSERLPLEQAIEYVLNGEITDSLSVAGLLKVALMMSQKAL